MTEQLLDTAQVGAALEQVGGRGVPQPVRTEVGSTRHLGEPRVHDGPHRALVQARTADAEEERRP